MKPDYIVCMECGTKHKMLKRHLRTAHGISSEQYRADHGLAREYPMVAPNYAEARRGIALGSGLGRKRDAVPAAEAPRRRRREKADRAEQG